MENLRNQAIKLADFACALLANEFTASLEDEDYVSNEVKVSSGLIDQINNLPIPCWNDIVGTLEKACEAALKHVHELDVLSRSEYESKIKTMQNEKVTIENVISSQASHLQDIVGTRKKVLENQNVLQQKEKKVKFKEADDLSRAQATFALYTDTFKLRWDYQCPKQEVKGCIVGKKEISPFSLNRDQHSEIYISNYLWDLVETCH